MRMVVWIAVGAAQLHGQAMFRGDAAHTGSYAGPGPRAFHGVRWKFATGGRIVGSPAVAGGVVYVGSDDNNVYALLPGCLVRQPCAVIHINYNYIGRRYYRRHFRRKEKFFKPKWEG